MTFIVVALTFAICWIVGVEHSAPKHQNEKPACEARK